MRARGAAFSPEDLQAALARIVGGGVGGFAFPPEERHGPVPLELPEPPVEPVALTVRVDVDGTTPPVWRRLVLHGDLGLDDVHDVIQAAFGWADSHLHRFWPGPEKQIWGDSYFLTSFDLDEGEEGVMEHDVRLDQVLRAPGDRLFYTYDFGDDWTHTITLEAVGELDPEAPPAVCTRARMAGPLEDCGGATGHNELVAAYRQDPSLASLEDYVRDWVPPGWDPADDDVEQVTLRLSLIGASAEEVFARFAAAGLGSDEAVAEWPVALEPIRGLATTDVAARIAALCREARSTHEAVLTEEDLAAIAAPYRFMVDLAGQDGIPLTGAGWMKPAVVERIYRELGLDADWYGKGNREDQTLPVAQLRARCQSYGLFRKSKGRLLRTRRADSLTTDADYVGVITARLLHDREPYRQCAAALFALLTASHGRAIADHADEVAALLTMCGLRTSPMGVTRWHALEMCRPVWMALRAATERRYRHGDDVAHHLDHRSVALARAALWPDA